MTNAALAIRIEYIAVDSGMRKAWANCLTEDGPVETDAPGRFDGRDARIAS